MTGQFTRGPEAFEFDESQTFETFDPGLALATAEHAVAVYERPGQYVFAVVDRGWAGGTIVKEGAAEVGLCWSPRAIVISARGTSACGDWISDLSSTCRVGWKGVIPPGARIGYGFKRQTTGILSRVSDYVRLVRRLHPESEIYVTGHSLGAALATLLVVGLDASGFRVRGSYIHASPRIGNAAWAEWYDERFTNGDTPTWRVTNEHGGEVDLVSRVPKHRWGFRHVGRSVLLASVRRDGLPDEEITLYGEKSWEAYRQLSPVGFLQALRVLTRTAFAVRAHNGRTLLIRLRRRVVDGASVREEPAR